VFPQVVGPVVIQLNFLFALGTVFVGLFIFLLRMKMNISSLANEMVEPIVDAMFHVV
jgi:hypothetical protein